MKKITNIFVSLFYIGYSKIFPGTIGTFFSIIIIFPIIKYNIVPFELFLFFFILIFILSLFFIKKFSTYTKSHDSSIIVIDEFLGIYLILIFYDFLYIYSDILTIILIFVLFRFFDVLKIFPANIIDKKMNNSLGVLLDDIVASVYTIIILCIFNVYS